MTGENSIHAKKTPLPESSINPKDLKGFIGRSDDLEHICRKLMGLEQGEVLTIKGAGGIGKTHIVKKIAVAVAERGLFSGGIHFIDCEPITDSRLFLFKAAAVFGLEHAEEDIWQHLRDHHDGQERLIIFDNFETLLYLNEQEEIKAILSKIADYAKVLVTCRELLKIEGKVDYQMRQLTTDEAETLFLSKVTWATKQEKELLRQEILDPLLNNNPLAITLITSDLPKGRALLWEFFISNSRFFLCCVAGTIPGIGPQIWVFQTIF
ncbi:MAG: NB-ARC domain-containing protein [Candidatus Electronema aureum]|uniref:NB-ARC domain-containing protein n=1 Tax=Candidatus Electronema aureum TaxID=2005002 RepID=A0A521G049_9BACT|nr:MAG: NB-ARC domain-containing protein [Candidatus Electronema aureum]